MKFWRVVFTYKGVMNTYKVYCSTAAQARLKLLSFGTEHIEILKVERA